MSFDREKDFNHFLHFVKQSGRTKDCFHFDRTRCAGGIIAAHSITENGRLSLIEFEVNKQKGFYGFESLAPTDEGRYGKMKLLGKGSTSVFHGFCKHHDTLFNTIEHNDYSDVAEHNFLHSYRSFAYSYHRAREHFMTYFTESEVWNRMPPGFLTLAKLSQGLRMHDLERRKSEINSLLERKEFDGLSYLTFQKEGLYPFAWAGNYIFPALPNNTPFKKRSSIGDIVTQLYITFLPGKQETTVILTAFKNDVVALKFLDQLDELSDNRLERAITSILIQEPHGTYFSPSFWQALQPFERKAIINEHARSTKIDAFEKTNKFFWSQFNFFDERFEGKKLGLY